MSYLYLGVAIVAEVIATNTLKATDGFTKPLPSLVVVVGYATAFYFLSLCLRTVDVGVAYAIWAGLGMVLVTLTAAAFHRQVPDRWAVVGISLIITGVLVLNLLSRNAPH